MKLDIHKSSERGMEDHGWLLAKHSFSFANYYNPEKMGFGALRVLNEDVVQKGQGFGTHPHDNMEIVTIVLEGTLEHKDSMKNHGLIPAGDIQRMSAGSGVTHSEYNHSKTNPVHLLQIWINSKEQNIKPSYEQKSFPKENGLKTIVSGKKDAKTIHIHQDARILRGFFDEVTTISHKLLSPQHGAYLFVIDGQVTISGNKLETGDAAAISDTNQFTITIKEKTQVLLIEVPLN